MGAEQEIFTYVNKVYKEHVTNLRQTMNNESATSHTALLQTYATFKFTPHILNLGIPTDLWKRFDDTMRKRIKCLHQEICAEKKPSSPAPSSTPTTPICNQYLTMNGEAPKDADIEAVINGVYNFAASELDDDDSISTVDDDADLFHIHMVNVDHGDIPVGDYQRIGGDIIYDCTESFHRANHFCLMEDIQQYAQPNGGADTSILGKIAYVFHTTGRYARLIGYDPTTTKSGRVPIVSAYLKTALANGIIVLLVVNEAPYMAHSTTTFLSEYKSREYGKFIDSCSTSHVLPSDPLLLGKQHFELGPNQHIDLINCGGIMALPIFPYIDGDDKRY